MGFVAFSSVRVCVWDEAQQVEDPPKKGSDDEMEGAELSGNARKRAKRARLLSSSTDTEMREYWAQQRFEIHSILFNSEGNHVLMNDEQTHKLPVDNF